jgi:hypothetical protein
MTGPIVFSDETAREQLLEHGEVVTFRASRRTTGSTWFRDTRTGPKKGDVFVGEIGECLLHLPDDQEGYDLEEDPEGLTEPEVMPYG